MSFDVESIPIVQCPKCGSPSSKWGFKVYKDGKEQSYRCMGCRYLWTARTKARVKKP